MSSNLAFFGARVESARLVAILLHGRSQTPAFMEEQVVRRLGLADVAFVAPEAPGQSWYPARFMQPIDENQPHLDRALARIGAISDDLVRAGVPAAAQVLIGFSQGACLACEYLYRSRRRFAALLAFTGGLVGPPGTSWDSHAPALRGTPILLGGASDDPWVPAGRMMETAFVFQLASARVGLTLYPSVVHEIRDEQIDEGRALLLGLPAFQTVAAG